MDYMLMPLRRYFDFEGRSRRKEFWMFFLLNTIVVFVLGGMLLVTGYSMDPYGGSSGGPFAWLLMAVLGLYWLAILIPSIAVQVRRFHDQDKSGWFVLLGLIPFLGGLVVLVFMLLEGTKGPNRFGPDPKGAGTEVFE